MAEKIRMLICFWKTKNLIIIQKISFLLKKKICQNFFTLIYQNFTLRNNVQNINLVGKYFGTH